MVQIIVEDQLGCRRSVDIPTDMGLTLMEVLKAGDYDILATCGGMALCATCHVDVVDGADRLPTRSEVEYDMLDTLPNATANSRLACQLRISADMEGAVFRIAE